MSSPSSTGSSKRKRTATAGKTTQDLLQPSSRDASGEELADSPSHNTRRKHNAMSNNSTESLSLGGVPPSKRARTRSNAAETNGLSEYVTEDQEKDEQAEEEIQAQDPGEPSSTTEDSLDIEEKADKVKRGRQASRHVKIETETTSASAQAGSGLPVGESKPIQQPPKAGMRDPIGGYKTNKPPEGRAVRVYADGVFDLFHLGHMRQLQQAKTAFPNTYLLVGVTGDIETHKRKGLTVLTGAERAETVRHCKWVDEVIPNCPWVVTPDFLEEHKVDFVAHDDEPYGAAEGDDIYAPIKKQGKFLVTERTEGVSTTGIITKIVRDYENYIARQLKRGTSRQELNVSWLKKNELDIKRHVGELRDSIRTNWSTAGGEVGRDLRAFWQGQNIPGMMGGSRPQSPAPGGELRGEGGLRSPSAMEHMKHLEVPALGVGGRGDSPGPGRVTRSEDFATGYTLGLIGGVKSWMMNRKRALTSSQAPSPDGSEDDEARSPLSNDESDREMRSPDEGGKRSGSVRGRKVKSKVEDFVRDEFRRDPLDLVH